MPRYPGRMKRICLGTGLLVITLACGGVGGDDAPTCPTLDEVGGLRLVYDVVDGDPAAVAPAMQRRIDAVGPRCATARAEGDAVVVEIAGPADPGEIAALAPTHRLSIRPRLPKPQAIGALVAMRPPPPIEIEGEGVARLVGADAAAELLAWVDANELPEGVVALVEPLPAEGAARLHLVRDDEGLLDAVVVSAEERAEDGGASVSVTLAPKDQRALAALSTQHVREALVIAVDDEVLSAPVLAEPLPSDQPFTLTRGPHPEDNADLARTLRAGSLPSPVTLRSEELVEPASKR